VLIDAAQTCVVHRDDGQDGAVVQTLPVGAEGAVNEEAVAGGVVPLPRPPGRADEFGAVDRALGLESDADAVGEVFAVGVGDGEGHDVGRSVGGDVGHHGAGEGFPGRMG
jgi:hypothetical protein